MRAVRRPRQPPVGWTADATSGCGGGLGSGLSPPRWGALAGEATSLDHGFRRGAWGHRLVDAADLVPDLHVTALLDVETADDHRDQRDDDRVDEARVEIASGGQEGGRDERQEAAEPAIAEVVRDRQAGVPDACREELDEEGRY